MRYNNTCRGGPYRAACRGTNGIVSAPPKKEIRNGFDYNMESVLSVPRAPIDRLAANRYRRQNAMAAFANVAIPRGTGRSAPRPATISISHNLSPITMLSCGLKRSSFAAFSTNPSRGFRNRSHHQGQRAKVNPSMDSFAFEQLLKTVVNAFQWPDKKTTAYTRLIVITTNEPLSERAPARLQLRE